jgi:tRNA threonylcarbamoyladenosine modification (KEOPS) complex  Pcc1 subunit
MFEMEVSVPFPSAREAEVAHNSLRVEVEPGRARVTRRLTLQGDTLTAAFRAEELRHLRVSVGSFFEHVVLIAETIRQFG